MKITIKFFYFIESITFKGIKPQFDFMESYKNLTIFFQIFTAITSALVFNYICYMFSNNPEEKNCIALLI